MRKNRKIPKKLSVTATNALYFGAVILMAFVMVILNLLASSRCQHQLKSIGEKERQLARLEEERVRESARWEEMKTPERLERALLKHGLAMRYPKAEQVIRMRPDGKPFPGQVSVTRVRQRGGVSEGVAMNDTSHGGNPATRRRSLYRRAR